MTQLSANEQKVLFAIQRSRAGSSRRKKQRLVKTAKGCLLAAVCASGLLVADGLKAGDASPALSAPALLKEGDAARRAGRLGPAILDDERTPLPAPHNAIAQSLEIARQKAGVAEPVAPRRRQPAYWMGFDTLAGLASISLLLFSLLFFGTRLIPSILRGLAGGVAASLPLKTRPQYSTLSKASSCVRLN